MNNPDLSLDAQARTVQPHIYKHESLHHLWHDRRSMFHRGHVLPQIQKDIPYPPPAKSYKPWLIRKTAALEVTVSNGTVNAPAISGLNPLWSNLHTPDQPVSVAPASTPFTGIVNGMLIVLKVTWSSHAHSETFTVVGGGGGTVDIGYDVFTPDSYLLTKYDAVSLGPLPDSDNTTSYHSIGEITVVSSKITLIKQFIDQPITLAPLTFLHA